MIRRLLTIIGFSLLPVAAMHAQFLPVSDIGGAFGDIPVEITSDGETRFEGGVAISEDNVQIHYKDVAIYSDYAEYNPDTRDVLLKGNIRVYADDNFLSGQRALYNLETKQMRALEFQGSHYPAFFRAMNLRAPSLREFRLRDVMLTTQDSSMPYWKVRARSLRIYPDDRVIMTNAAVYMGKVPIMWFPYLFAPDNTAFEITPGYDSRWGAYLLTGYAFPVGSPATSKITGMAHVDYRTEHGIGLGLDLFAKYGKNNRSGGKLITYYARDEQPSLNFGGDTGTTTDDPNRGRVTFKHKLYLTEDIYATADINYLSDANFLEDYYPAEFTGDPQPDNNVSLTKWNPFYTMNVLTRFQMNPFQETTERLPEAAWDFVQHPIFGSPVFYDGSTTVGYLRQAFADTSNLPNYESGRFDTFHQISFPKTYFDWLSIIPRAGIRGTFYDKSGYTTTPIPPDLGDNIEPVDPEDPQLVSQGAVFRPVFNAGVEASFKLSRAFEQVQSRKLGVDGVRHIAQPYTNFSYVHNAGPSPSQILQFDQEVPSTELIPLDFPQFTGIDSLDSWAIWRAGIRNRLQTRRNNQTYSWFFVDTYMDYNFENPYTNQTISNLVNQVAFYPVPWAGLRIDSQMPVAADGYTEFNISVNYMPVKDLSLSIGDRLINGYQYFEDSNQITFYSYWRINDNWSVSMYEQYEAEDQLLVLQRYMVHRDLSSWVVSVGAQVRNNQGGPQEFGLLLTFTLKDAPGVSQRLAFDPGPNQGTGGAGNGY